MATHIDKFDELAKRILIALHEVFPAPHHLTPSSLGLLDEEPKRDEYGGVETSDEWNRTETEIARALSWLVEEGYITDRQYRMGPSHVLSTQGFRVVERISPSHRAPLLVTIPK